MKTRAYIDIETTGLSWRFADLTVIGIALEKNERCKVVQLLDEDLSDEKLLAALHGVDELYSYNGSRFDLPFIHPQAKGSQSVSGGRYIVLRYFQLRICGRLSAEAIGNRIPTIDHAAVFG